MNAKNVVWVHSTLHPLARTSHMTQSTRGDWGTINFSGSRKSKCWMCLLYIRSLFKLQSPRNTWKTEASGCGFLLELALRTCIHITCSLLPGAFIFSWSLYQFPEDKCHNSILIQKMFAGCIRNYNLVLTLKPEHRTRAQVWCLGMWALDESLVKFIFNWDVIYMMHDSKASRTLPKVTLLQNPRMLSSFWRGAPYSLLMLHFRLSDH